MSAGTKRAANGQSDFKKKVIKLEKNSSGENKYAKKGGTNIKTKNPCKTLFD